jgi:hypothetical protein
MQSSVAPGAAPANSSNSPTATQLTSNDGLNWGTPSAGSDFDKLSPRTTVPATGTGTIASNATPSSFQKSNEPAIAVPTDGDSLRFALPAPEPAAAATVAAAPVASASTAQPVQLAAAPTPQSVLPAAYLAPVPSDQSTPAIAQLGTANLPSTGPWRSPQIAPPMSTATLGVPTLGVSQPDSMDVRLRAVPSPPQPVESTTPRIRIPAYSVPATATGASMLTQPSSTYIAQTSAASPLQQTVQIGPLPPPPGVLAANYAVPQVVASGDGFRPRSSSR